MPSEAVVDIERVKAGLAGPLERSLHRICGKEVDQIKADVSVPVERDAAGNVVVRSAPGERPRLEHAGLQGGIGYRIKTEDGLPAATIYAARPPLPADEPHSADAAQVLEFGGESPFGRIQPRPFMQPAAERIATYAADVTADELGRNQ